MNLLLREKLVRQFFGGLFGGRSGSAPAPPFKQQEALTRQYVADTERDANRFVSEIKVLGADLQTQVRDLGKDLKDGLDQEEAVAIDRLTRANNWLANESDRLTENFGTELRQALDDLEAAAKTLNLDERGEMTARIEAFQSEAAALDNQLRTETESALTRMERDSAKATEDYRTESLSLGDTFLSSAQQALQEYRGIMDEAASLDPARLQGFLSAADYISKGAQKTRMDLIDQSDPNYRQLREQVDAVTAANLDGRIDAETMGNLARSGAFRALSGGFSGGGEMQRNLQARDLGLTALDLQGRGTALFDSERRRRFDSEVAGLQADPTVLLRDNQRLLESRGKTQLDAGLQVAQSDRDQRMLVADRTLGSRLTTVDTRRAEDLNIARSLYGSQLGRSRDVLGLDLNNTAAFFNRERAMADTRFNTESGISNTIFRTGLGTAGSLYGTNVNANTQFYSNAVAGIGSIYGQNVNAANTATGLVSQAEAQRLANLTQARTKATATLMELEDRRYQHAMNEWAKPQGWFENAIQGASIGMSEGSAFGPWGAAGGAIFGGVDGAMGGPIYEAKTRNGYDYNASGGGSMFGGMFGGMGGMGGMSSMGMFGSNLAGSGGGSASQFKAPSGWDSSKGSWFNYSA